ncbi:MAG: peptidylprolyl isomerase, partial [Betaproteobacteria bacterium]
MFSVRSHRTLFATFALVFACALPAASHATMVRLTTPIGAIDIVLYDTAAPQTVANFLTYVNSGAYVDSFIHRSVPGFVIQGGGYFWNVANNVVAVPQNAPVINEFSATRSNRRGTVAMAKLGGNPNSATSQWFINLADNSANLDTQNGGFTVFGEVTASSMAVVDAIASLQLVNAGAPFDALPIIGTVGAAVLKPNLVLVTAATAVSANYQGLWWNANESGWGMSLTQHGDIIFSAIYTYDAAGKPIWYVITNCPVTPTGCTGDIYRVNGGTAPTVPWTGAGRQLTKVGTGTLDFASASAGTFSFSIDGVAGSKAITQQIFATGATAPTIDYTDLWWNQNESGWGVSLTQQFGTIFAAWYAYDTAGNPVWYVATNCPVTSAGCTGDLYQVTGGAPLTATWKPVNPATMVGTVTFTFTDAVNGSMNYSINGVAAS